MSSTLIAVTSPCAFYHTVDYDILLRFSVPGTNALKAGSNTMAFTRGYDHGLEIQYPGPAVLIRYNYVSANHSPQRLVPQNRSLQNLHNCQLFTIDGRRITTALTPELLSGNSRLLPAGIYLLRQPDGIAQRIRIAAQ